MSINRRRGLHRLLGLAVAAVALGLLVGEGSVRSVTAQTPAVVSVQKQLVGPTLMPIMSGDLSGYVFQLQPLIGGNMITLPPTNSMGTTAITVAQGDYIITEQPRPGATLISFTMPPSTTPIGSFSVPAMGTVNILATNQVAGSASITVTKQVVDNNNQPLLGADLSGFIYQVTGPSGFMQSQTTGQNGMITFQNLAAGSYAVTEQPRTGYTFVAASVDFVPIPNGQPFQVMAGQTRQVLFQNRIGTPTGTVRIQKELVDANLQPIFGGDRSGFQLTVTCGQGFTQQGFTDGNGVLTIGNVPAGTCTIFESARMGFTLVSIVPLATGIDIGNNGSFMVTAGQTAEIRVRNQPAPTMPQTEMVQLFVGCNNQALTWPAGTPVVDVANAITPQSGIEAIWYYDTAQGRFFGFSPVAPFASDYNTTRASLEAVFICMRSGGTLNRPAL